MNVGFVTKETAELSVRRVFGYWANTLYLGDAIQSGWIVMFDLVSLGENINKAGI